jgi:hypothetical protein
MFIITFLRVFSDVLTEAYRLRRDAARRYPHLDF